MIYLQQIIYFRPSHTCGSDIFTRTFLNCCILFLLSFSGLNDNLLMRKGFFGNKRNRDLFSNSLYRTSKTNIRVSPTQIY